MPCALSLPFSSHFLIAAPLAAQKDKPEPLTEAQQDQIAEAGIYPVVRVGLYVKFLDEHSDTIKGLIPRAHTEARVRRLNGELQNFSALMDELGDNLDVYSERKADIRKSLKALNEGVARWQRIICTACPASPASSSLSRRLSIARTIFPIRPNN